MIELPEISADDQQRIAFAQRMLDGGKLKATRFNDPAFLSAAVKRGLLKGTASLEEAYTVFGKLLRNDIVSAKRLTLGMVGAIQSLTPQELLLVKENISDVLQFPGKKS